MEHATETQGAAMAIPRRRSLAAWCEAGLQVVALILPPLLALASRGVAVLAIVAGLCAAGLVVATRKPSLGALRRPALPLLALAAWGALSALWSIDPERSLMLAARLAALFAAALALAAAAGLVAAPRRLAWCLAAGMALGLVIAGVDYSTGGGVLRHFYTRPYRPTQLNQFVVMLTILALPLGAMLVCRGRVLLGIVGTAAMLVAVAWLVDTGAKLALVAAVPVGILLYWGGSKWARAGAVLSLAAIAVAPLALPRLAQVPALMAAADSVKNSGGHRLLIWRFAGDRIAEHPLIGWGLDSSRMVPGGKEQARQWQDLMPLHPHNAALQLWLELGLPGAALFALLVSLLWWRLADAAWPPLYTAAAGGGLTAALVILFEAYGVWQEWWLGALALMLFLVLVMGRAAKPER